MKKLVFACFILATVAVACGSDQGQSQADDTAAGTAIDPASVRFVCEPVEEPNIEADAPRHEVFVQMGDKKVKVADILNCDVLPTDQYASYQIPEGALHAVLGWWAGGGDLLYIAREGGNFVVKQGYIGEEMEGNDDPGFKTVIAFSSDGRKVN